MAKIKPMALVESMSGKACMHSDVYFRTNKVTGQVFSGKLCNPYDGGNSTSQVAVRNRFSTVAAAVRTRIAALTTDAKAALLKEYHSQTAVGSFFGYCYKKWNAEYNATGALING